MENIIVRESSSEIRTIARNALSGNAVKVFGGMLAYTALAAFIPLLLNTIIPGIQNPFDMITMKNDYYGYSYYNDYEVNIAGSLYELFISGAFELGLAYFMIAFFRKKDINAGYIFTGFEHYLKALGLAIVTGIFIFLWSLLLIVPGVIASIRYSQSFYILADNPDMGIMDCIRESKRLMFGNKGKYFSLCLSFIGWLLLAMISGMVISLATSFLAAIIPSDITVFIISCITAVPVVGVMTYLRTATMAFYDLVTGKLIAQPVFKEEDYNY